MAQNVAQNYSIFDSIGIVENLSDFGRQPPGWFSSFSEMGNAGELYFMNMRNKSNTGLAYCNQDSRDLMPYGFYLKSITVDFIPPRIASEVVLNTNPYVTAPFTTPTGRNTYICENSPIFSAELPTHCGVELRINTDIHLKCSAAMCGSSCGPVGGGFGGLMLKGDASASNPGFPYSTNQTAFSQGIADLDNGWAFPVPISIPRKAAVCVTLKPSEWARELIKKMPGPGAYAINNQLSEGYIYEPFLYIIRVGLHGVRLLQQRGEYHA